MPITLERIEPGIIYSRTSGSVTFREMAESREAGVRLLQAAGDSEWVLIMDVEQAKLPRPDMNVDSLRSFSRENTDLSLLGYVVIGASPSVKLLMSAYRALFKVEILFETSYTSALAKAHVLLQGKQQGSI